MFQLLLITALCADTFTASFSYGIDGTKIPVKSMVVISAVCTAAFALAIGIGSAAKTLIPVNITKLISFSILFALGAVKCFESLLKRFIAKNVNKEKSIKLKLFDINFMLTVYADNIKADADRSKVLSAKESVYLALALSLDGIAAGIGCGMVVTGFLGMILLSLFINVLAAFSGYYVGKYIKKVINIDFSWLGGFILVLLAFFNLK